MNFQPRVQHILKILLAAALIPAGCKEERKDDRCVLTVETQPAGALVVIDNQKIGDTPVTLKIPRGPHVVEASKLNFKTELRNVSCADPIVKLEIPMKSVAASVLIRSKPDKAAVILDGEQVGETPLILHNQPVGSRKAILRRPGSSQQEVSWEVKGARPVLVEADMLSSTGTLSVDSDPPGADITINDEPRGKTPFKFTLEHGQYKVKLSLSGYASHEDVATVSRDKTTQVKGSLKILPGSLAIVTIPEGADIIIIHPDGKEERSGKSPFTMENLQPGTYQIKIQKPPEFDPESREITIRPGAGASESITLSRNTGALDIVASPPGATVYVDGKLVGRSAVGADGHSTAVMRVSGLAEGQHKILVTHKNGIPKDGIVKVVQLGKREELRVPPITLWVRDTHLKLSGGRLVRGKLILRNDNELIIESEPGIREGFPAKEILEFKKLEADE